MWHGNSFGKLSLKYINIIVSLVGRQNNYLVGN